MLVDVLLAANNRSPDKPAVDDGRLALSYKRLTTLASVLRDVVQRESSCANVGVMLPASALFPAALFGTLWASRVIVPLNFLLNPTELTDVVRDADLDLILTVKPFAELVEKLPARALFIEDLPLKRMSLMAALRRRPPVPTVDGDDTAVILYTSGTAAEPKGVELSYTNLSSNCTDSIVSLGLDVGHTMLNVLPPFHVFGLTANVLVPVFLGTSVYAMPRFNPGGALRAVSEKRIALVLAIPSMYAAMLRLKSAKADSLRSLRLAVSGGEPLPESVRTGFEARFGIELRQGYGLTETSPVVATCSEACQRVGTVGRSIPGTTVRIISDDGRTLGVEEEGEILVLGPGVMKGYYKKPKETSRVIDADGWLSTGDIGRLDADGFLSITGRAKEMMIIGGENVFPREIEAVLETHEAVLQCAVVGVPDAVRGEVPVAFVIPVENATVDERELRNHAKRSLAGFKVPRRVIVRDDLPKGPTGKILKRQLAELVAGETP